MNQIMFCDTGSTNDWFMDTDSGIAKSNANESLSSLLCARQVANDDHDMVRRKKEIYESRVEGSASAEDTHNDNETGTCTSKKKKEKMALKKVAKMIRRKKKTSKDDEGSIGIASITSSLNTNDDCGKKKKRFKFLSSLRRKNKGEQNNAIEKCEKSHIFEEEPCDINENFIINTMEMMELEDLDDDELDESSLSECDKQSLESETFSRVECEYTTLS